MATSIISNEKIYGNMETLNSFEESGLQIRGINEIIENKTKEKSCGFLSKLLGTLGAFSLGNFLTGKE